MGLNTRLFTLHFYGGFDKVADIVFSFDTNFVQKSIPSYQTIATIKGN